MKFLLQRDEGDKKNNKVVESQNKTQTEITEIPMCTYENIEICFEIFNFILQEKKNMFIECSLKKN